MLKNRDLIIFGDDWGRYPSTIQYIGKVLSKYNRIIWVGSLGLRKPELSLKDLSRVIEKLKKINSTREKTESRNNVFEVHPRIFPFHDYKWIRKINNANLEQSLLSKMKEIDFKDPIVMTASPVVGGLVGKLGESSFHYLCLDDWAEFDGAMKCLTKLERELLDRVDSSFAISEILVQNRKPLNGDSYFFPQGVNYEHFNRPKQIPEHLKNVTKPVIGYFGLIANYIDIELIRDSALYYPDYTFLIIGKTTVDLSELTKLKNVIYTGPIDYANLPDYAGVFDAGLIPFRLNELTIASNPLKLVEYLSLGIPVISTALPEVKKFGKIVYAAETNRDFIQLIEKAVKEDTEQKRVERRTLAADYSWESIADRISETISEIDGKKRSIQKNKTAS